LRSDVSRLDGRKAVHYCAFRFFTSPVNIEQMVSGLFAWTASRDLRKAEPIAVRPTVPRAWWNPPGDRPRLP
jgi:hypothetical protein